MSTPAPDHVLASRNINASAPSNTFNPKAISSEETQGEIEDNNPAKKNMEYHRQVLQSRLDGESKQTYISPSDTIMSPCTAKLSALKNKRFGKAKPQSLFAKTSSKNLSSTSMTTTASAGLGDGGDVGAEK